MTTDPDHENRDSTQRHADPAATVDNTVHGSVTRAVVQAGVIHQVSITESAVGAARTAKRLATSSAPAVDEQLRLLAAASWNQWTAAANDRRLVHPAPLPIRWRRSSEPVAGPVSATGHDRFDPLPGLTILSSSELQEGGKDALHQVYGALPSGRLLLIGKPGSGKSSAAILLLLDALRYREQATAEDQARIPVPVLFTLHGWHPDSGESVTDWMAGKLAETYPMFRGRAGRHAAAVLLSSGRVTVFLDGLDEIPETARPGVLEALADAPFRLVLLSRTAEAVAAAHHGPLAGAIALELQPVHPADAAAYLLQPLVHPPPAAWQTITDHLGGSVGHHRPTGAVSTALSTPLTLSLLGDVYGPTGPVDELLDAARFPTAADIDSHLLDHAITAAYTPRPGHPRPRYSVATAERTLRYLATRLTEHGTSDLAWWHIPTWATHRSRMIRSGLRNALTYGLVFGFTVGFSIGPVSGLVSGLLAGPVCGLMSLFVLSTGRRRGIPIMPRRITPLAYRSSAQSLSTAGLTTGLPMGLSVGILTGIMLGVSAGLVSGLSTGLACGLIGAAGTGLARHTDVHGTSLGPAAVWRHDRNAGLVLLPVSGFVVCLLAVLAVGLVPGLATRLASRLPVVLSIVLLAVLVLGLVGTLVTKNAGTVAMTAPGAAAAETALAAAQLTIQHKIPLRLIVFLEDARSRHLLRTVGPVYQFRHAKLQVRLTQTGAQ